MLSLPTGKLSCLVLASIAAIASYLLFVPPIVGVADQGDYYRLTERLGLSLPALLPPDAAYHCWVLPDWRVTHPKPLPVFSTGELPGRVAILAHRILIRTPAIDIRTIAAANLAVLLALIFGLFYYAAKLSRPAYLVILAGTLLVATDSEYLAYFNSFYTEPSALLGVFAFLVAGLTVSVRDEPSWGDLAALVFSTAFLAGSKAQNAILVLIAGVWLVWLFRNKAAQRNVALLAVVPLLLFARFVLTRAASPESNLFNAVYGRVLPNSLHPETTLAELGLNPDTARWNGKTYWEVPTPSASDFPRSLTRLGLVQFYATHPAIDYRMARQALTFTNDIPYLGNYAKQSGLPCLTRTAAFTGYDRFRMHLASVWFLLPFLLANAALVILRPNRKTSLIAVLSLMAIAAFAVAAFYDAEPRKHLFTFNLLADVLFFADLCLLADLLTPASRLTGRRLRTALAILVMAVAAIALERDLVSKGIPPAWISPRNLALGKPAMQSSVAPDFRFATAAAAVDGNTDGSFYRGSTTHTGADNHPWWQVDLTRSVPLERIVIWNRTDCCGERLRDYWIFVSDTPFAADDTLQSLRTRSGMVTLPGPSQPEAQRTILTRGARGRYVRIQLDGPGPLSLAEVQVFEK